MTLQEFETIILSESSPKFLLIVLLAGTCVNRESELERTSFERSDFTTMKTFAEKVNEARLSLGLTKKELAEKIGVSGKTIQSYEAGEKRPRQTMLVKLARALEVSVKFLSDDSCTNPVADIEKDTYIEDARNRYGASGVRDMDKLLADNRALFAGGKLSQEQKDAFFQAVMTAYVTCREESKKFGRKNS